MKGFKIETKFDCGDKVYIILQADAHEQCSDCRGTGKKTIKALNEDEILAPMDIICSKCLGKGTLPPVKKWTVVESPLIVSDIKIKKNYNQFTKSYTLYNNFKKYNRNEKDVFQTKSEAQKECNLQNAEKCLINQNDIKISSAFKQIIPSGEKIAKRIEFYKQNVRFDNHVILNSDGYLIDGYTQYLVCKMLGIDKISVIIKENRGVKKV